MGQRKEHYVVAERSLDQAMPGDDGLGNVGGNVAQAPQDSVCGVVRKADMTPISSADIQRWLRDLFVEFNVPQYAEHIVTIDNTNA